MTSKFIATDGTRGDVAALARLIGAHAPYDGTFVLRVAGIQVIKVSRPSTRETHSIQQPSVCIVAQGEKSVLVGDDSFSLRRGAGGGLLGRYPGGGAGHAGQLLRAVSRAEDRPRSGADHGAGGEGLSHGLPQPREARALYVGDADRALIDAATRLMELMEKPGEAELLAPLVIDEILIRLLRGPMGSRIAQLGRADSSLHRIGQAVGWLRTNFDQPVEVEELAKLVHMSVSTFHRQFRAVTSMNPLQFQKTLRLQEARRLMLTQMLDASSASRRVGYVSASQFTREYGRFFGAAPTRDIHRLREEGSASAEASA